jgi:hypothetical protein
VFVVRYADLLPEQPTLDVPPDLLAAQAAPHAMPDGLEDFLAVTRSGAKPPSVAIDMDNDVALMTYTSGTTGLPKGAMLSFRNALYKTDVSVSTKGIATDDVLLAIAPLYHIAGMLMGVNIPMLSGATTVLLHRFDPLTVLQAIERHRVTWWYSIAPMNVAVMAVPSARSFDLSSLRENTVTSFGIAFTETLAQQWRSFAPNCESMEAAYGLSETHTMDTYMPNHAIRWGTHGIAVPGNQIRIIDPDTGVDKPVGEPGEIILKNKGVFKGYWNKPEATAKALKDGWVYTGDMGKMDAEGYLTFMGRFKEMIKVSGYSVFPEEVELLLIKHPAVAQAAVIGIPDPEKGEVVTACSNLAKDLGAKDDDLKPKEDGPGKKAEAACDVATKLVGEFKAKAKARPYWRLRKASEVVDFDWDADGELAWCYIEGTLRDSSDPFSVPTEQRYRDLWTRTLRQRYVINPKTGKAEPQGAPVEHGWGFVPAVLVGRVSPGPIGYDDVENLTRVIMDLESVSRQNYFDRAYPQLYLPASALQNANTSNPTGGEQAAVEAIVGLNYPIIVGPGDTAPGYIMPNAGDMGAIDTKIAGLTATLYQIAGMTLRKDKAGVESRPDYRGSLNVAGVDYWLSGWIKESEDGKWMSLSVQPKGDRPPAAKVAPRPSLTDDDIPFAPRDNRGDFW